MLADKFELHAFYSDPQTLSELIVAKIDGIIIDLEVKGKNNRQSLYNTQINKHTTDDLAFVCDRYPSRVICRINGPGYTSTDEINRVIDLGATEILVPMIKEEAEAEFVLRCVNDRIKVGLMLETNEALAIADQLNRLPVHRFFVGLNDLAIQRKSRNVFLPFIDGTLDLLRPKISAKFGVAGLTHPNEGIPIPCSVLINQMKKYGASFSFLRRSFYKDLPTYGANDILSALRNEFDEKNRFTPSLPALDEIQFFNLELI